MWKQKNIVMKYVVVRRAARAPVKTVKKLVERPSAENLRRRIRWRRDGRAFTYLKENVFPSYLIISALTKLSNFSNDKFVLNKLILKKMKYFNYFMH